MWVADGNADTDHIQTQDGVFPIMGGWAKLKALGGSSSGKFHQYITHIVQT